MTHPFLRSEVGTYLPICQRRARLAVIGRGSPVAASTPSSAEVAATAVAPGTTPHWVAPACSPLTLSGVSPDGRGCFPVA